MMRARQSSHGGWTVVDTDRNIAYLISFGRGGVSIANDSERSVKPDGDLGRKILRAIEMERAYMRHPAGSASGSR